MLQRSGSESIDATVLDSLREQLRASEEKLERAFFVIKRQEEELDGFRAVATADTDAEQLEKQVKKRGELVESASLQEQVRALQRSEKKLRRANAQLKEQVAALNQQASSASHSLQEGLCSLQTQLEEQQAHERSIVLQASEERASLQQQLREMAASGSQRGPGGTCWLYDCMLLCG
jgi:DNA repair exonuclease SbcCD ATPase subunit